MTPSSGSARRGAQSISGFKGGVIGSRDSVDRHAGMARHDVALRGRLSRGVVVTDRLPPTTAAASAP